MGTEGLLCCCERNTSFLGFVDPLSRGVPPRLLATRMEYDFCRPSTCRLIQQPNKQARGAYDPPSVHVAKGGVRDAFLVVRSRR